MPNILRRLASGFRAVAQDREYRKANFFRSNTDTDRVAYKLRGGSEHEMAFNAAKDGRHDIAEVILLNLTLSSIGSKFNQQASAFSFNARQNENWHDSISEDMRGYEKKVFGGWEFHVPYIDNADLILNHAITNEIVSQANNIGIAVTFGFYNLQRRGIVAETEWCTQFYPSISFQFSAK